MSEYIEIETEMSDDGLVIHFFTNLKLAEGSPETYDSMAAMEEGSPVAQALSVIEGVVHLHMVGSDMIVTRDPDADWHVLVGDVSAVLKDFFL